MSLKTIYHNGAGLLVSQEVLDQMGLHNGQSVTEAQVQQAITLNAAQFVGNMDLRRIAGEKDIPDTSELKKLLAR